MPDWLTGGLPHLALNGLPPSPSVVREKLPKKKGEAGRGGTTLTLGWEGSGLTATERQASCCRGVRVCDSGHCKAQLVTRKRAQETDEGGTIRAFDTRYVLLLVIEAARLDKQWIGGLPTFRCSLVMSVT